MNKLINTAINKVLPTALGCLCIGLILSSAVTNHGIEYMAKSPARPKESVIHDITGNREFKMNVNRDGDADTSPKEMVAEAKESSKEFSKEVPKEAVKESSKESETKKEEMARPETISLTRFGTAFTVRKEILQPVLQAREDGVINTHTAAMFIALHVIESPYSGWGALGCNVNNLKSGCINGEGGRGYGRYGVGLLQVMSYPEWGIANKAIGKEYTIQESLKDPIKQIEVIKGLMMSKTGETNGTGRIVNEYNESQMNGLARSWLGEGCDKHGTCTGVYAKESVKNYSIIFEAIK